MITGVCKHCGCTSARACPGGCAWVDEQQTVCSVCLPKLDGEELLGLWLAEFEIVGDQALPPIAMRAVEWLPVFAALQLARSHPQFYSLVAQAAIVDQFAQVMGELLSAAGPCTAEVVRRGWRDSPPPVEEPARASSLILPDGFEP